MLKGNGHLHGAGAQFFHAFFAQGFAKAPRRWITSSSLSLNACLRYSKATISRVGRRGRPALEMPPPVTAETGPNKSISSIFLPALSCRGTSKRPVMHAQQLKPAGQALSDARLNMQSTGAQQQQTQAPRLGVPQRLDGLWPVDHFLDFVNHQQRQPRWQQRGVGRAWASWAYTLLGWPSKFTRPIWQLGCRVKPGFTKPTPHDGHWKRCKPA